MGYPDKKSSLSRSWLKSESGDVFRCSNARGGLQLSARREESGNEAPVWSF